MITMSTLRVLQSRFFRYFIIFLSDQETIFIESLCEILFNKDIMTETKTIWIEQ